MHPAHWLRAYIDELASLPALLCVLFVFFPAVAYLFACCGQRRVVTAWADIRAAVAPGPVYRCPTVRFDIAIFALQLFLVMPTVGFVGSLYSAEAFAKLLMARSGAAAFNLALGHPLAAALIQVFAAEVLGGFGAYIYHYAGHKTALFWSLHKVHHSAEALSPFTMLRGHPIDTVLGIACSLCNRTLVIGAALYFTGGQFAPLAVNILAVTTLAGLVQVAFNHTHVPLCHGWFNRIWVGPSFHHIHHSLEPRHRDKNLGGGVPVWDWIFGTMYLPRAGETYALGLNEHEIGQANPHNSFQGYILAPMAEFGAELGKLARGALAAFAAPNAAAVGRPRSAPRPRPPLRRAFAADGCPDSAGRGRPVPGRWRRPPAHCGR